MAKKTKENFFDKIPVRREIFRWKYDEENLIVIEIDNKGFFNRLLQVIAKKPKVSYIHLDEMGSFVWQSIDGEKNILQIGKAMDEHFGEDSAPVYERLVKFMGILSTSGFIEFKK